MTSPVWFLHFHKEETIARGRATWALYFAGQCYAVHDIDIRVVSRTRIRTKQPVAVIHGRGYVKFDGDRATITETEEGQRYETQDHIGVDAEQAISLWECESKGRTEEV